MNVFTLLMFILSVFRIDAEWIPPELVVDFDGKYNGECGEETSLEKTLCHLLEMKFLDPEDPNNCKIMSCTIREAEHGEFQGSMSFCGTVLASFYNNKQKFPDTFMNMTNTPSAGQKCVVNVNHAAVENVPKYTLTVDVDLPGESIPPINQNNPNCADPNVKEIANKSCEKLLEAIKQRGGELEKCYLGCFMHSYSTEDSQVQALLFFDTTKANETGLLKTEDEFNDLMGDILKDLTTVYEVLLIGDEVEIGERGLVYAETHSYLYDDSLYYTNSEKYQAIARCLTYTNSRNLNDILDEYRAYVGRILDLSDSSGQIVFKYVFPFSLMRSKTDGFGNTADELVQYFAEKYRNVSDENTCIKDPKFYLSPEITSNGRQFKSTGRNDMTMQPLK